VLGTVLAEIGFYHCASFIAGTTLLGVLPALFINEELRKVNLTSFYNYFNSTVKLKKAKSNTLQLHRAISGLPKETIQGIVRSKTTKLEDIQHEGFNVERFKAIAMGLEYESNASQFRIGELPPCEESSDSE
jgi:hypothetical protein